MKESSRPWHPVAQETNIKKAKTTQRGTRDDWRLHHQPCLVEIVEESQGQSPSPGCGFAYRGVDDPVQRGAPLIVGPSPHEVSEVDDKAILDEWNIVPDWILLVFGDLQPRTS